MSAENIVQQLQKSMDMIAEERLKRANFDSTVEGTIIAINDRDNGVYLVQIQNAKFEAYAQTGQYYEGETVYVQVPQGDYTKLKFITGRKTTDENNITNLAFRFKYPFDDFIALYNFTENGTTLNKLTVERSWRANKPADGAEPNYTLANINSDPNIVWHWYRPLNVDLIGTTLGIQMDVKTYLGQYNPIDGDYGLRILVRGDEKQEDGRVQQNVVREFYFNTDLMYGNPYGFIDETTQQALIDVSKFVKMDEIAAYFWQDHQFTDDTDNAISYKDAVNPSIECEPNIYLSKFSVGFGYQTKDIGNEDLRLYTYDDVEYGRDSTSTTPRAQLDTRTLRFGWVHKCPDDNYMMINSPQTLQRFNDEFIETEKKKAHIYWFKQLHSDEEVEGIPYVEPGTSVMDLETKLNNLRERMNTLINSTSQEMFSSVDAYNQYIDNIRNKYTTQINAVQDMIDNSSDQTLQRLSTMGGIDYRYISGNDDNFTYTCLMDIHQYRERFKVVVAWENTYEVSEPFEFKNVDSNVLEELAGKRNEIVFRMLREQKYKENNTTKTRLIEENSLGNFFVYDENNNCIQNEEETFWSDIYYYILVWIWDEEHETYVPLTTTSVKDPVTVEWEFPTNNTMIKSVAQLTSSDITSFQNSLIPVTNNFDGVQASTRKFKIDDYWDMRKHNNIIRATINRNGKQHNIQKMLTFGQAGTMGSKYTLRIDLIQPQGTYTIVQGQPFKIQATVYDQNGNLITEGSGSFTYTFQLLNNGPCKLSYQQGYNGLSGNTFGAVLLSGSMPPLFLVGVDLHDPDYKYEILNVKGFMCCSSATGPTKYDVGCPDRVEYKSDGVAPVFDSAVFTVYDLTTNSNSSGQPAHYELVYPTWEIRQWAKGGSEVSAANRKFLKLDTGTVYESAINTKELTTPGNTSSITHTTYKLDPYYDNSGRQRDKLAFFWDDDMYDSYPTFIGFTYNSYTFWQAIAFAHNVYASSIVNNWDGQLTIDKEKNAILTRMLAAGVKDTKNRFNGVMMGDWSDYGDTSIDPIGLYGFQEGVQSFAFKNDGTGFIGKAGHGLIVFDGTNALISDYEKEHYINLNPVYYHVVDGLVVRDKNRGSYSQYFLYAKNAKLDTDNSGDTQEAGSGGTTSLDNGSDETQKYLTANNTKKAEYGLLNTKWAKTFILDTTHDYFAVDPNNGVYMSGGLIARYGKIGDCLELSSAGLTYAKNNGIIFIGEERTRDGKVITSSHPTNGYDDLYWSSQKGDKYNFRNGAKPSASWGRYVVWIGDATMKTKDGLSFGIPKYLYPNFGIEHNGIVHLNKAYVQGEIHASSLLIGLPDGNYHDVQSRFATTYYTNTNPALSKSQGGVCNEYGDLLLEGDLWYDTNTSSSVTDLSTFQINVKLRSDGTNTDLDTSAPAADSDFDFTIPNLSSNTYRGYVCYEWKGYSHRNEECTEIDPDKNGNYPVIANHKGWRRLPVLSKDTLTELGTLAMQSTEAIKKITSELTSVVKKGYKQIRNGMSPISFFKDGQCFVNISGEAKTVSGFGSIPAGIAIYQVNSSKQPTGKYFLLNGTRMGFYYKTSQNVDIPLLAYYDGNMGLAGNLYFGLEPSVIFNNTALSVYKNFLDGPNAKISLGDGSIVLDSDVKNAGKTTWNPKITLGSKDGKATILLAGFNVAGDSTGSFDNLKVPASLANADNAALNTLNDEYNHHYNQLGVDTSSFDWDKLTDSETGIVYNTASFTLPQSTKINNLNKFEIYFKSGVKKLGYLMAENDTNVVFMPCKNSTDIVTGLYDWDYIEAKEYLVAKQIKSTSIFCKDIYIYTGSTDCTASKVATLKWVVEQLKPIINRLGELANKAQSTGNNALGFAKGHTHKTYK